MSLSAASCPPALPAFPPAGPGIRREMPQRDLHRLKQDLIIFPPSDPKPALSLQQMHPKGKGAGAAERSALRSDRYLFHGYVGFISRQFSGTVPVGFGRGHSRGSFLPRSWGSPCESPPVPPVWTAAFADRVLDGGIDRNLQFPPFQVSPAGDIPGRRDSPGQP